MSRRKAQMFIVTAVFLTSMLFFLQQALVTYSTIDNTRPFLTKEVYILKGMKDGIERTIKQTPDCIQFQENVEEYLSDLKDDVSAEGYVLSTNFDLDCNIWNNAPPDPPPFTLSIRLSKTYDATGKLSFYHS